LALRNGRRRERHKGRLPSRCQAGLPYVGTAPWGANGHLCAWAVAEQLTAHPSGAWLASSCENATEAQRSRCGAFFLEFSDKRRFYGRPGLNEAGAAHAWRGAAKNLKIVVFSKHN